MEHLNEEGLKHMHEMTKYHVALRHVLNLLQDRNKDNQTVSPHIYKIQIKFESS